MVRGWILIGLVACSSSGPSPGAAPELAPAPEPTTAEPRIAAGEWRCFVVDPNEPELPQGNVTHTKQRLVDGRLETANVHIQHGRAGSTRIVYRPTGDLIGGRLEADFHGVTIVAELHRADASHWTLHYHDPSSGWRFTDESKLDGEGLTITSTDPAAEGGQTKTTVRFLNAPCEVVDAALARHPPPP